MKKLLMSIALLASSVAVNAFDVTACLDAEFLDRKAVFSAVSEDGYIHTLVPDFVQSGTCSRFTAPMPLEGPQRVQVTLVRAGVESETTTFCSIQKYNFMESPMWNIPFDMEHSAYTEGACT